MSDAEIIKFGLKALGEASQRREKRVVARAQALLREHGYGSIAQTLKKLGEVAATASKNAEKDETAQLEYDAAMKAMEMIKIPVSKAA